MSITIELGPDIEARVRALAAARGLAVEAYVREVLERDVNGEAPHPGMTFREILAPAQEGFAASGMTDEALVEFAETEVKRYRADRRSRESSEP